MKPKIRKLLSDWKIDTFEKCVDFIKNAKNESNPLSITAQEKEVLFELIREIIEDEEGVKNYFKKDNCITYTGPISHLGINTTRNFSQSSQWESMLKDYIEDKKEKPKPIEQRVATQEGVKYSDDKLPMDTMFTKQFPKALKAICKATMFGHNKYKEVDQDFLNFKRVKGGSTTYANALQRHNEDKGNIAEDSGLPHIYHKAWNALAELELWIEENNY